MTQFVSRGKPVPLAEKYTLFIAHLESYGHEITRRKNELTERITDVKPPHADFDADIDTLAGHFHNVLSHAEQAHELAVDGHTNRGIPAIPERIMADNLQVIRNKLLQSTLDYIHRCLANLKPPEGEKIKRGDDLEAARAKEFTNKREKAQHQRWKEILQEYEQRFKEAKVTLH